MSGNESQVSELRAEEPVGMREVDPQEVAESGNSRVSKKIIEEFLERRVQVVELNPDFYKKPQFNLRQMLSTYVKNHELPIRVFESGTKLHLERTDWDQVVDENAEKSAES
jgi:hypothetical protein